MGLFGKRRTKAGEPQEIEASLARAQALTKANRVEEGLALARETAARAASSPHVGPGHEAALLAGLVLAQTLVATGDWAAAEAAVRDALPPAPSHDPQAHRITAAMTDILAYTVDQQGRHAEALDLRDAVLAERDLLFPAGHPMRSAARSNRAATLCMLDRPAEAEAECRAALGDTPPADPAPVAAYCATSNDLAFALSAQGRHAEADATARAALALVTVVPDPLKTRLAITLRTALATALNGQERHADALELAESAWQTHLITPGARHGETGALRLALATALAGLGRVTEAAEQARLAADECAAALSPVHYRTLRAQALHARITGDATPPEIPAATARAV